MMEECELMGQCIISEHLLMLRPCALDPVSTS